MTRALGVSGHEWLPRFRGTTLHAEIKWSPSEWTSGRILKLSSCFYFLKALKILEVISRPGSCQDRGPAPAVKLPNSPASRICFVFVLSFIHSTGTWGSKVVIVGFSTARWCGAATASDRQRRRGTGNYWRRWNCFCRDAVMTWWQLYHAHCTGVHVPVQLHLDKVTSLSSTRL